MVRRSVASLIVLVAIQIVVVVGSQWNERVLMETSAYLSVPPGWNDLGRALPDQALELTIAIKHQHVAEFEQHLLQVSTPRSGRYGQHWTLKQVSEFLAPQPSASPIIHTWLNQNQIYSAQEIGNDWIRVLVSVEQAEQLLSITIHKFEHRVTGLTLFRTLDHYSVPRIVAQHIDLIGGLIRFPKLPRNINQRLLGETTPASIQKMYDITVPPENANNLQAVASFLNQYFSPSDLSTFEQQNSLPNTPIARVIGTNLPNLPGVEASLDVQFLLGTPDCSIETWVISTGGRTDTGNEPFLDFLVNLQANTNGTVPKLISMSYQDYEYTVSEEYANRCNEEFMKYSMNGTTFITGSGDWGVGCVDSDHCTYFTADFPSSSPYVISTGATTLSESGQEIGVSFSSGGFSNYFAQPSFQAQAVSAFLNQSTLPPSNFYNASGRAFPDVSAIGTGFQVVYRGSVKPVGGTSASTPTFGSILSMINSQRLASGLPLLGYALPFLYDAWAQDSTAFLDITDSQAQDQGCCGASFTTVPGWDPYTGLGTPNYSVLLQLALDSTLFA